VRKFIFLLIYIATSAPLSAEPGKITANQAGYIVHMLNYLSNDYINAVENGKVKSEDELKEMIGFAGNIDKEIKALEINTVQKDTLLSYSGKMVELVNMHEDQSKIKAVSAAAKRFLLLNTGLKTFPSNYPSISKGKTIYTENCSKCHGDNGNGGGKDGALLDPKPRNFLDNDKMKGLSPFAVFNTVRYGIEGTGMKAHNNLSDNEVWDVSFFVLNLRHGQRSTIAPTLSLEEVATKSDDELKVLVDSSMLSTIRTYEPDSNAEKAIDKAKALLAKARELCLSSDLPGADKLVTLAYLEGIEPYEFELKKTNPELIPIIEKQIAKIHETIQNKESAQTIAELKKLDELLAKVETSVGGKDYKPLFSAFMTLSILMREGLEALLVIIIFMNILSVTNLEQWKKYVHVGWISALGVGGLLWILLGEIIKSSKLKMELLEGSLTITAVFLLVYVGFWLHKKSSIEQWKVFIQQKIKSETGKASFWGIFSLSFLVVFREIFESILFISTVDIQSRGEHRMYILLGCLIAFALIVALYFIFTKVSKNIPFKKIINLSIAVLSILAVTLVGKGIHSFQEAGVINQTFLNFEAIDLLGIFPTWQTLSAQVLMIGFLWFLYKSLQTK
jgi:high-affinity iron transporter